MALFLRRSFCCRCYGVLLRANQHRVISKSVSEDTTEIPSIREPSSDSPTEKSFEELLESSQLMKIRRPQGRTVIGKITNVCNDDLYVDFGGKFYVVVKKPAMNPEQYEIGKHVRIMVKKLEMTGHFLGQNKHITLLEADGWLLGLHHKQTSKS